VIIPIFLVAQVAAVQLLAQPTPARSAATSGGAAVEVVVFSDFQCPYCRALSGPLRDLQANGVDGIPTSVTFKHFPLSAIHPKAQLAHQAAAAAARQGKFWEMHDLLFANQGKVERADLMGYARTLNLDVAQFERDLDGSDVKALVAANIAEGEKIEVGGTPTILVNGKEYVGNKSAEQLRDLVRREFWRARTAGEITDAMTAVGRVDAPVELELFADLQSSVTASTFAVIKQLQVLYPTQVRVQFRHFPLTFHPQATMVHEASVAAARAGRFWDFATYVVEHRSSVREQDLIAQAGRLGIDRQAFADAVRQRRYAGQVEADLDRGRARGLKGSPAVLLDGHRIDGVPDLPALITYVEAALHSQATLTKKD